MVIPLVYFKKFWHFKPHASLYHLILYIYPMDLKKLFGTVLTILGIGGLIYTGIMFANESGTTKMLVVYGVLGAIFFFSGISLVRRTSSNS